MLFLLLLLLALRSHAVSQGSGLCINDLFTGGMGPVCTAEDAEIRDFIVEGNATMYCMLGENVTAHLYVTVFANAAMRYDFGIVVALDGGTGATGTCANFNLEPVSVDNTDINVTSGNGPFFNGELGTADTCGDVRSSDGDNLVDLGTITFECADRNMDGMADVAGGIAWDNQVSDGSGMKPHCTGPDDVMPGTASQCQFDYRNIGTMIVMTTTTTSSTAGPTTTTGTAGPTTTTSTAGPTTTTSTAGPTTTTSTAGPTTTTSTAGSTTTTDTAGPTTTTDTAGPTTTSSTAGPTTTTGTAGPTTTTSTAGPTTTSSTAGPTTTTSTAGPTTTTSTAGPTTTTGTAGPRQDKAWIIGPVVGGILLALLLCFCACLPRNGCPWFSPSQGSIVSTFVDLTTGFIFEKRYLIGQSGPILLHQPPFEVRIARNFRVSVVNARGNVLYLNPNKSYALHICNDSGEPISPSGILQGLLVNPAEGQLGRLNLRIVYDRNRETKTVGTYTGPIRLTNVSFP